MTTLSFYARGDGSSANNAALNVENPTTQQTVQLTFDSGLTGDIVLEYNAGAPDPDTKVIINGISYNFKVELTGVLPLGNPKVPDPLEGKQVTVVSVVIAGVTERFFFVTDGSGTLSLINQFGNGAIPLKNANFAPPPVYICFCSGTEILTPAGYRKIQTLRIGDHVLTHTGDAKSILWIGHTDVSFAEMLRTPERRPIRIAAHAIAPGVPFCDLYMSAQHRIVLDNASAELLFGERQVLVAAKHLVGSFAAPALPAGAIAYYHLLLADHDMVISNGLASESLQLSPRVVAGLADHAQMSLARAVPAGVLQQYFSRADALFALKASETKVLTARMSTAQCENHVATDAHYGPATVAFS